MTAELISIGPMIGSETINPVVYSKNNKDNNDEYCTHVRPGHIAVSLQNFTKIRQANVSFILAIRQVKKIHHKVETGKTLKTDRYFGYVL